MSHTEWYRKMINMITESQTNDPFQKVQNYPILMQFIAAYNREYPRMTVSFANTNFDKSAFYNVMDKYFRNANDQRKAEILNLKQKFNIKYYEPETMRQKSNWLNRFFMAQDEKNTMSGFILMILLYSFWNLGFTVGNENYILNPPEWMKPKPRNTEMDHILVPLIQWYFGPEGIEVDDGESVEIDSDSFLDVIDQWLAIPGNQELVDEYYDRDYDLGLEPKDKSSPEHQDWEDDRSVKSHQKLIRMLNGYVDPDGVEYEIVG